MPRAVVDDRQSTKQSKQPHDTGQCQMRMPAPCSAPPPACCRLTLELANVACLLAASTVIPAPQVARAVGLRDVVGGGVAGSPCGSTAVVAEHDVGGAPGDNALLVGCTRLQMAAVGAGQRTSEASMWIRAASFERATWCVQFQTACNSDTGTGTSASNSTATGASTSGCGGLQRSCWMSCACQACRPGAACPDRAPV